MRSRILSLALLLAGGIVAAAGEIAPWWAKRHDQVFELIKANPNIGLVLVGDSITQDYEKSRPPDENFQTTWQRFYGA